MGISGVTLKRCFEFLYRDEMAQHFGGVFSCKYDGPLKLDPQEVESAEWWSLEVCLASLLGSMRQLNKLPHEHKGHLSSYQDHLPPVHLLSWALDSCSHLCSTCFMRAMCLLPGILPPLHQFSCASKIKYVACVGLQSSTWMSR